MQFSFWALPGVKKLFAMIFADDCTHSGKKIYCRTIFDSKIQGHSIFIPACFIYCKDKKCQRKNVLYRLQGIKEMVPLTFVIPSINKTCQNGKNLTVNFENKDNFIVHITKKLPLILACRIPCENCDEQFFYMLCNKIVRCGYLFDRFCSLLLFLR